MVREGHGYECTRKYVVVGGFAKHEDTSTSFVAPLLIALSMTLNVTLSETKRSGVKSKCNRLKVFQSPLLKGIQNR